MRNRRLYVFLASLWAIVLLFPNMALAYVGPGAGLSAIGTLLALIAALIFAIFGFVWYPLRRLLRKRNSPPVAKPKTAAPEQPPSAHPR